MCLHVGECIVMPDLYVNMHEVVCVRTSVCSYVSACVWVRRAAQDVEQKQDNCEAENSECAHNLDRAKNDL